MRANKSTFLMFFLIALAASTLGGCATGPETRLIAGPRMATVMSVREVVDNKQPTGVGMVAGAIAGGALGSLIGGGRGRTVATVAGAVGGGYLGNRIESNQTTVSYEITLRFNDGSYGTIIQNQQPYVRPGDRVRVTENSIELIR
jgi:outer membrane lipoprotein SlyB